MKKKLAILLAACLLVQALGVAALGEEAEPVSVPETILEEAATEEIIETVEDVPAAEAIVAEATAEATEEAAVAEATAEATEEAVVAEATAEATEEATVVEATAEATEEATVAEATAEATEEATVVEATAEATEEAVVTEATAEATEDAVVAEATAEATEDAVVVEETADAAVEPVVEEVTDATAEPVVEEAADATAEPVVEEIIEATEEEPLLEASYSADEDFVINSAGVITEYKGTETDIIIPNTVGGVTVTGISETAFARNSSITSILLNQAIGLNYIEKGSFENCTALKSVSLTNSPLVKIEDDVFKGCSNLTAISWPNALNHIGDYAFANCTALTGLALPNTVSHIGNSAFSGCTALQNLLMQDGAASITIGSYAFSGCTALKSIYLPNKVTDIGNSAFENCSAASVLSLPTSITEIKNFTFSGCTGLTWIEIPAAVKDIGREAFYKCSNVGLVTIPSGTETIGSRAFDGLADGAAIFIFSKGANIASDGLGTTSKILGYIGSTAQTYANNHSGTKFIPMEIADFVNAAFSGFWARTATFGERLEWAELLRDQARSAADLIDALMNSANFTNRGLSDADAINAVYRGLLDRDVDSTGLADNQTLMDQEHGLSIYYVARNLSQSGEFVNRCAARGILTGLLPLRESRDQSPSTTAFVCRCYLNLLGRKFDIPGLNNWTNALLRREQFGASLVGGFIRSQEFTNMGLSNKEAIRRLYKAMLNREPDAAGWQDWQDLMKEGVSIDRVAYGFVASPEFEFLCQQYDVAPGMLELVQNRDKNVGLTQFVARCYTKALGRSFDVNGLNHWTGVMLAGAATPQGVAEGFIFSAEARMKNWDNTEFVKVLYRVYMGREYDTPGLTNWVNALNNGVLTRQAVSAEFAKSPEFSKIVASYGL
ncbi:MAG: leucine-rich repeat protein [Clostridia bacterium]|nr:leucine-rich repeat protein [Clostridia bacterium]